MGPRRRVALAALVVLAIAGAAWWLLLRPRVFEVPFTDLPVLAGRFGLDEELLAAEGWPLCTPGSVDLRPETGRDRVSVTVRPHEDVQCALPRVATAWWTDGAGERFDAPGVSGDTARMLLMGAAGASGSATLRRQCPVEEPVTLHIELDGTAVEVGSLTNPDCSQRPSQAGRMSFRYRLGGVETPMGWLDAVFDAPRSISGDTLPFVLEMINDTGEPIPIGRCPFYDVRFITDSARAEHRSYLNCPAAPDRVRPGDVIRFEIELPLEDVTGSGHLEMELNDENRTLHRIESEEIEVTR